MTLEPPPPPEDFLNKKPGQAGMDLNLFRLILIQPKKAFAAITSQTRKPVWLPPVVFIAVLVALAAVLSSLVSNASAQNAPLTVNQSVTPTATRTARSNSNRSQSGSNSTQSGGNGGFTGNGPAGNFTPPDGAFPGGGTFAQANPGGNFPGASRQTTATTGTNATTIQNPWLSALASVAGFLVTWLILGGLTNLFSLSFGGRSHAGMAFAIAGWASIPVGVRNLVQSVYTLVTHTAIKAPGLSGFLPAANGNNLILFAEHLLSHVDLYFLWQAGLLAVGVGIWGGLARKKALLVAGLSIGLILILQSLLGLGVSMLSSINLNTNMLFFLR